MSKVYIANHIPDLEVTPVSYVATAAVCPDMGGLNAYNTSIERFQINNDPQVLWFWAIGSACALIKKYEEDHPEASEQKYVILVPDPKIVNFLYDVEQTDCLDGDSLCNEYRAVKKAIAETAPFRISFDYLEDPSEKGYRQALTQAELAFIERVSQELHFPNSSAVVHTQDLSQPFYDWDLGNGHHITSHKADPHDEARAFYTYCIPTPSHLDFFIHRTILIKDRQIPRDQEKASKKRTERKAWRKHKKEVKTEFLKKHRSE